MMAAVKCGLRAAQALALLWASAWMLPGTGAAASAADRTFIIGEKGAELVLSAARVDDKKGKSVLRLTLDPVVPLSDRAAQEAAENFFERFVLASAARYSLDRAVIYIRPLVEVPGGAEQKSRLFRFDSSGSTWSLENHRPVETEQPYLNPVDVKLADGARIEVERMQRFKVRTQQGIEPLLRVEILLEGLNPMAERGNVYLALSQFWNERLRAKAEEEGAAAAEVVAAFEPRTRRYAVRDQLALVITRDSAGAWPSLPALDNEIAGITADASPAGGPHIFFGTPDRSRFDLVLNQLLNEQAPPPVAGRDPRI